jgi:hypothetical protein
VEMEALASLWDGHDLEGMVRLGVFCLDQCSGKGQPLTEFRTCVCQRGLFGFQSVTKACSDFSEIVANFMQ